MPKELNMSDKVKDLVIEEEKKVEKEPKQATPTLEDKDKNITPPVIENKEKSNTPLKKVKKFKITWPILVVIGVLLILGIAAFYYFGIYKLKPYKKPSDIVNIGSEYLLSNPISFSFFRDLVGNPQEPRTEVSPLNGLLFTKTEMKELKERRPVAVMFNNHDIARPQSGLNSADLVYEADVEGGITRYMAIFWSEAPKKVGPIRSIRQYYIEWLSPYDPLLIHDGCASSTDPRVNACGNLNTYNIKDIATVGAWRWNDGRRYAPHNEYSSITNAWEYSEKVNWDGMPTVESWKFKNDAAVAERGTKSKTKVTFHTRLNNHGAYDAIWTYDSKTNNYLRTIGGKTDIDQETNTQVYAKNVIVQEVSLTPTYDNKSRIILTTIGQGKAVFLMDGKVTEGTWKKSSRTDRTTYYDKDGKEVQFNRGRTWISVIPRSEGKFDIIE